MKQLGLLREKKIERLSWKSLPLLGLCVAFYNAECPFVGNVCKEKGCPEPSHSSNDDDYHWCFDFRSPVIDFDPSSGAPPIEIAELTDLRFIWTYDYIWDSCEGSTAGWSGDFTVRWWLETGGARVWECTDTGDPACQIDDVLMGSSSGGMTPTHPGLQVPGDDPSDSVTYTFCVELELTEEQECTSGLTDINCPSLESNVNCLQFNVTNCPCDAGHMKKDLLVSGLVLAAGSTGGDMIQWTNSYAWEQCGQEADQITEETGAFSERISITPVGGGTPELVEQPATSVPLNSSQSRSLPMPILEAGTYDIAVGLFNIASGVECRDTAGNNETTIRITL